MAAWPAAALLGAVQWHDHVVQVRLPACVSGRGNVGRRDDGTRQYCFQEAAGPRTTEKGGRLSVTGAVIGAGNAGSESMIDVTRLAETLDIERLLVDVALERRGMPDR